MLNVFIHPVLSVVENSDVNSYAMGLVATQRPKTKDQMLPPWAILWVIMFTAACGGPVATVCENCISAPVGSCVGPIRTVGKCVVFLS